MVALAALIAAAAAWALAGADDFRWSFGVGLIALGVGIVALARRESGWTRAVCIVLALTALPATAAIRMDRIAGGFEPYALWLWQYPSEIALPVAPEGERDPRFPPRRIVNLTSGGEILLRGDIWPLGQLGGEIAEGGVAPIMVRADYTTPWLHFTWILDAARAAGADDVRLAAAKHVKYRIHREDRSQIRGRVHAGNWPEVELRLPLQGAATGARLHLAVEERETRERWPRPEFEYPLKVRYELEGRITTDLDELGRWMREQPPALLEAEVDVPLMLVAAVLNECSRTGIPMPALVTPRDPTARELEASRLAWPSR